jgi:hypothetical protein
MYRPMYWALVPLDMHVNLAFGAFCDLVCLVVDLDPVTVQR